MLIVHPLNKYHIAFFVERRTATEIIAAVKQYGFKIEDVLLFFLCCFLCHNQSLLPPLISWRGSTLSKFAIFTSISREGCILLEHHRETVASFLPICSANHFPVLPFSTNTTFSLFIFCDSIRFDLLTNCNTLIYNANVVIKPETAAIKFRKNETDYKDTSSTLRFWRHI